METENQIIIHIDSKDCIKPTNNTNNIIVNIKTPLSVENDEHFSIELLSATIPYSFYAVNYSNKYLDVFERKNQQTANFTITMPEGNYNIIQFLNLLQTKLNTESIISNPQFVVTYDKFKNKASFTANHLDECIFKFKTGPNEFFSMEKILGFIGNNDVTLPATSNSTCDVNPYSNIFIHAPNLGITNCFDSLVGSHTTILQKIPVNVAPFSYIFYSNKLFIKYISKVKNISTISLELRDEFGLAIDLNNNDWYCSLKITKVKHNKPVFDREQLDLDLPINTARNEAF